MTEKEKDRKVPTVTLTIRIAPELKRQARIEALRRGITLSDLIRDYLEEWLSEEQSEDT